MLTIVSTHFYAYTHNKKIHIYVPAIESICNVLLFLVILVLPQAVTQFEELIGMAEAVLKGGGTMSTSASTLWRATNNSSPDSFASMCSNSNSNSSSPVSLKAEEEHHTDEKQVSWNTCPIFPGGTVKNKH